MSAPTSTNAADDYPNRPVRVIVNSSAGGLTDVVGRLVTSRLSTQLGHSFVIDNRAGQAVIGADALAKSKPDGYTIGVLGSSLSALPALLPAMPFNPERDLVPVALLSSSPLVLVTHPTSPYRTLADYVKAAKARPGELAFASGGVATMGHLLAEQLQVHAGLQLIHVPYKGGAPAMTGLLAGQVSMFFDALGTTINLAKEARVRPLALAAVKRAAVLPDVPTLAEAGYAQVQGNGWYGMFAPSGTSPDQLARLNAEVNKALQAPEVKDKLTALGSVAEGGSPQVLADLLTIEVPRWSKLVRERGIKPE